MKKLLYIICISVVYLICSINQATADTLNDNSYETQQKIAVMDIQRVVMSSKKLKNLNSMRDKQISELRKMADEANEEINRENREDVKKKISEKHLATINTKKEEFDKIYAQKIQELDRQINSHIASVAKEKHIDVVITKNSVVYGDLYDITDLVIHKLNGDTNSDILKNETVNNENNVTDVLFERIKKLSTGEFD